MEGRSRVSFPIAEVPLVSTETSYSRLVDEGERTVLELSCENALRVLLEEGAKVSMSLVVSTEDEEKE